MSGASPLYFNALSGASGEGVNDYRTAGDAKLTHYFDRFAIGVGAAYSNERDYISRAGSIDFRTWTEDKNRTFAFGFAGTRTASTPRTAARSEQKHVLDFLVGVTQVCRRRRSSSRTSPTRAVTATSPIRTSSLDDRPDHRRILAWLTRWNQHFPSAGRDAAARLRVSRRLVRRDSNMLEAEWVHPLPHGLDRHARPALLHAERGRLLLRPADRQRLRARRAVHGRRAALGLRRVHAAAQDREGVRRRLDRRPQLEFYEQRASWRLGGDGSPGLLPFSARWIQVGVTQTF